MTAPASNPSTARKAEARDDVNDDATPGELGTRASAEPGARKENPFAVLATLKGGQRGDDSERST